MTRGSAKKSHGSAAPVPAPTLSVSAPALAEQLGVAVEAIARLAHDCGEPGEISRLADGSLVFTAAVSEKISARVALDMAACPAPVAPEPLIQLESAPPAPPSGPNREDLRLTRVFRWSTNVLAERPNGNEVVVRVKSVDLLERGMVLRSCIQGEMGWTYEGRLPRTIGERQLYYPPAAAEKQPS